jgi:transposase
MTSRHQWSTPAIIETFYGQADVERAFKDVKNPHHLAIRPQFHWTDQKIRVHF